MPRSTTTGFNPALASVSAANRPAGPMPTIRQRREAFADAISVIDTSSGGLAEASWFFISAAFLGRRTGRAVSTSRVRVKWTSPLSLASTDLRTSLADRMSSGFTRSARAASCSGGRL